MNPRVAELSPEPLLNNELAAFIEAFQESAPGDVVLDFSAVGIVTSASLAALMQLRMCIEEAGHRLVLSRVSPATRGIFTVTSLNDVFEFCDDRRQALAELPSNPHPRMRTIWP